jgi:hypothetical protein
MDYIQIDRTNCLEIIFREFPAFKSQWELYLESWNSLVERPVALDIAEFADFAVETICLGVDVEIEKLVAITELMLAEGDSVIKYAFRRMFLEQIAHGCRRCKFPVDRFIEKLQPLTYYYWQSLDRHLMINQSGVVAID